MATLGPMTEMKGMGGDSSSDLPTMSLRDGQDGAAPGGGIFGTVLAHAQTLFDVSTEDVVKRMKLALWPFKNDGPCTDFRSRPDFYGPFWIATTAVLFLAAT